MSNTIDYFKQLIINANFNIPLISQLLLYLLIGEIFSFLVIMFLVNNSFLIDEIHYFWHI